MEEKNNDLDNLIIQSDKSSGLKKMLLAAAVLLLVLILIILVTKSLVQPEQKTQSSIILPPEPAQQAKAPEPKEPLFEEVPIEEEKPAPSPDQTRSPAASPAPVSGPVTQPTARPKPVATPKPKTEPVAKPKPKTETAARPKPVEKPRPAAAQGRYYIQVGAFFRYPPDKKFLRAIEKEGLRYVIVEGVKNGSTYKKVLVGPYPSRKAAGGDLDRIKRRINQNAYILKK